MDNETDLTAKFLSLKGEAEERGLCKNDIHKVFKGVNAESLNGQQGINSNKQKSNNHELKVGKGPVNILCDNLRLFLIAILPVIIGLSLVGFSIRDKIFPDISAPKCAIEIKELFWEIARPVMNCEVCRHVYEVPIEHKISVENFSKKYAYTAVPVLIKEVTTNWTAMKTFSYGFLKSLYVTTPDAFQINEEDCEFFPYKTEFKSLEHAFNMSDERAQFKPGEKPWYFGWSSCNPAISEVLRKHYKRPYFLPNDSESSSLDWLFMGGSGPGAHVHLDYVQRPSWQAQISGKKTWTLIPPPECEEICHSMNITVHKGDIIVVDANQWYHSTYIHPGEISITIGSEYD